MKNECELAFERLNAWENTEITGKPIVCVNHAENTIKKLREHIENNWPGELVKYDEKKLL